MAAGTTANFSPGTGTNSAPQSAQVRSSSAPSEEAFIYGGYAGWDDLRIWLRVFSYIKLHFPDSAPGKVLATVA
jgi:hypothetical protein